MTDDTKYVLIFKFLCHHSWRKFFRSITIRGENSFNIKKNIRYKKPEFR